VELAIRTAMVGLGGALLDGLLRLDPGHRGPRVDCGNGHQAEFVSYRGKTIDTVVGTVRLRRAWYHCAACKHGLAPRDGELGVTGESLSPGLASMNDRAAAAVPFAPANRLLAELAGVELPDKLYIAVDGTGVPVVAREAEGRKGKADDGKARTREIKLACLFTQTRLDDDGKPVRDPASTTSLATFEPAETFGILLDAEARRRGIGHIRQPVVLGDGAAWIWNLADQLFPAASQIVDLYHAREHLHELASLAARLLAGHRDDWLAARLEELDNGDTSAILAAGRALGFTGSLGGERDKALHYFEANAHRMRYQHFRDLGMFVGSGVVEAGCKSIGQRLKLSGMRWTIHGATGIATLRCLDASGRRDEIWQRPHSQIPTTAQVSLAS